jgi:hypothetical protein
MKVTASFSFLSFLGELSEGEKEIKMSAIFYAIIY